MLFAIAGGCRAAPADAICRIIDRAAAANRLPAAFLTRVLWQESRFHSDATSPAGAEGVAQFMPQTAAERGLGDPRDPVPAIEHAARLLAELDVKFGNLGLAAAAYNAGPGRVAKWLAARSDLPVETRRYVAAVTGRPAEDWRSGGSLWLASADACAATVPELIRHAPLPTTPPVLEVRLDRSLAGAVRLLSDLRNRPAARPHRSGPMAQGFCASVRTLGIRCSVY